ncbi:hypothetical protein LOC68_25500 [Blastopirellula sp. JC732]|uniref:Tetratricopeptide repeat protein n=1 Tax=Blastopirellula sediminis TaxID=2894196 RepID=A0A9X1SJC4_9BACT|nr:hypothetical protein [Blastopirellula sediminis]MCC9604934.1 hypothetical protein [Blastopirellula sediminis]MCC9631766.1 hypothetical protein [Blastopirellula sediminis]
MPLWVQRFSLTFALAMLFSAPLCAEEPREAFLDGLIEQGYYDPAMWYIEQLEKSPKTPAAMKATLPYRKAIAQLEVSRTQRNPAARKDLLDQADSNLEAFVKAQPKHDKTVDARMQRGAIMLERAKLEELLADREKDDAAKKAHMDEAAKQYDAARGVYQAAVGQIRDVLKEIPSTLDPKADASKIELRDELRGAYVRANLLAATSLYEKAKITADDKKKKELLTASAKEFDTIFGNYRKFLSGLYARLYQAECELALGDTKKATTTLQNDLMILGDQPQDFRLLKLKSVKLLAKCWDAEKPPKYEQIVKVCGEWYDAQQLRVSEDRDPEWIELKLQLARAYQGVAPKLEKKEDKAEALKRAVKLVVDASKYPGPYQKDALALRTELQGADAAVAATDKPPETFQEANEAGRAAMQEIQSQTFVINKLKEQLAAAKTPAEKEDLAGQIKTAQEGLDKAFDNAGKYLKMALGKADVDVSNDDLNVIRYSLAFLAFQKKDYFPTMVQASFVARRYPTSASAKACAKLALASALLIYQDSPAEKKDFEVAQVKKIVNFIATQWAGEPESNEALSTLVGFEVAQGQIEEAEKTLAKIPADSIARSEAELKLGQSIWVNYLRGMNARRQAAADGAPNAAPTDAELTAMKDKALKVLTDGVDKYTGKAADYSYVIAALSLAQIYTDIGEPEKAFPLFEKDNLGLLKLVESKSEATSRTGLPGMIYKAAVRAYISALPNVKSQADTDAMMTKAEEAMTQLKALVGEDEAGKKQLVATYISLAKDLQTQLENAPPAQKKALSAGFEAFLNRVGESTKDPLVLNWVGETFYGLGVSMKDDPTAATDAAGFFNKAITVYERIISEGGTTNPQLLLQVKVRIAAARAGLGEFEPAMETYVDVLKENPMMVNVQVDAAKMLYDWGLAKNEARKFGEAIQGAYPNDKKQNSIWGWGRIQSVLARYASKDANQPAYREIFFEARYNMALARFQFASRQSADDAKQKYMAMAEKDILSTEFAYPDMGGDEWRARFDALLKKIQTALHKSPVGLSKPEAAAS